jgi:hypothetical protein
VVQGTHAQEIPTQVSSEQQDEAIVITEKKIGRTKLVRDQAGRIRINPVISGYVQASLSYDERTFA